MHNTLRAMNSNTALFYQPWNKYGQHKWDKCVHSSAFKFGNNSYFFKQQNASYWILNNKNPFESHKSDLLHKKLELHGGEKMPTVFENNVHSILCCCRFLASNIPSILQYSTTLNSTSHCKAVKNSLHLSVPLNVKIFSRIATS